MSSTGRDPVESQNCTMARLSDRAALSSAVRASDVKGSTSYALLPAVCLRSLVSAVRSNGLKAIRSSLSASSKTLCSGVSRFRVNLV